MARTITKTAKRYDDFRVYRQREGDGTFTYHITVGYHVDTDDGESFTRDLERQLTGTAATAAANMFARIDALIDGKEGLR